MTLRWPVRGLFGLVFLAVLWWLDVGPRQAPLPPMQAAVSVRAVAADLPSLQKDAAGFLPMATDALTAHASNLLAMPLGHTATLTACWFSGDRESAPNVQIAASQFDRASQTWLPARNVVDRIAVAQKLGFGVRRLGNPVGWLDTDGRMHLFVVGTGAGGWAAARILHLVQSSEQSDLAHLSFVPVNVLPLSWLWNTSFLVRNSPLQLADGGMLLPVHFELGWKYPAAVRFDAHGNFVGMVRISAGHHLLQPTLVVESPTQWRALMRSQAPERRIGQAVSDDAGQHWHDVPALPMANPDSALQTLSLNSNTHLLVHNSTPQDRSVLDLSRSTDGQSWQLETHLMQGGDKDEYSYPSLAYADGAVWVSYTDHRKHIAWQRFVPKPGLGAKP